MPEYFIVTNSFAAPFMSDMDTQYIFAESPEDALARLATRYRHPAGLYAAVAYASADAYHKGKAPLARWMSNAAAAKERAAEGKGSYSICGYGPGVFTLDGITHKVADPKAGSIRPA